MAAVIWQAATLQLLEIVSVMWKEEGAVLFSEASPLFFAL
jgi:hypothetical protein